jgi:lipoate-protein ligase A
MIWRYVNHNSLPAKFNMDFDVKAAQNCGEKEIWLRFYRWRPYAVSLGANQSPRDLLLERLQKDGMDWVVRPTGGRAILHAEELTYSVVIPHSFGMKGDEIYNRVSRALVLGLRLFNPVFEKLELENYQPDFRKLLSKPSGVVCFNSTARHEVKFEGKKIIGSAQRIFKNAVLQHGSILVGSYHLNLVKYLNVSENVKENLLKEMKAKTTDIKEITGDEVDYEKLKESLLYGFRKVFASDVARQVV